MLKSYRVTSLAEVWIETAIEDKEIAGSDVTSLAEVWIETVFLQPYPNRTQSLPLRKCGLKRYITG